jgi:hypothetical protein
MEELEHTLGGKMSKALTLMRWITDADKTDGERGMKNYLQEWTRNWESISSGGPSSKEPKQLIRETQTHVSEGLLRHERALMPLPGHSEWDRRSRTLQGPPGNRVMPIWRDTGALQENEADVAGEADADEGQDRMKKDVHIQPLGGNDDIATSPADALSAEEASLVEYFVEYIFQGFTAKFQTHGHADQVDVSANLGRGQGEKPSKKRKGRGNDDRLGRPWGGGYDGTPPSDPGSDSPPLFEKEAPKFGCQVFKGNSRDPTNSQSCLRGWCQINRLKVCVTLLATALQAGLAVANAAKNDHLSRHHRISLDTTISHEEVKRVCGKSNPTDVERWKAIFRILFPGLPIPSPCK